mmetsp:Transcript_2540/g.6412  ORF Transcript_2540/g.6412 Transcript_2540/m.6412 type:complete len:243 (-) Transcript_2540:267-995(-)
MPLPPLEELAADITTSADSGREPRQQWIELTFREAPVHLHSISFCNYYTYSIAVLHSLTRAEGDPLLPVHAKGRKPQWQTVIKKHVLMASPHYEDDAQAEHVLDGASFVPEFDPARVTRLRFVCTQPSPTWKSYSLRHIRCFTLQMPELSRAQARARARTGGHVRRTTIPARRISHDASALAPRAALAARAARTPRARRCRAARAAAAGAKAVDDRGRPQHGAAPARGRARRDGAADSADPR